MITLFVFLLKLSFPTDLAYDYFELGETECPEAQKFPAEGSFCFHMITIIK